MSAVATAHLQPGSSFGRYVVEVLLGEGGMGQVYRARDTVLNRAVALKLLLAPRADADAWREATARMLREARASAAFEHPNAVHIYDVGQIDGTPYIAMEYVRGRTLRDHVGDASVPWETRLRWLVDVASALGAAHEAGLVHRDVKPHNVMVRDDGRVKVLDFGIARRVAGPEAGDEPTITTEGLVVGTMHYMPPEQLAGGPLDGRADQFAWGVMAYELLSGERPWPRQADLVATVTAILSSSPEPLTVVAPFVPPEVARAIHRALSKLAPDRFDSMADLMAVIEPYATAPVPRGSGGQAAAPGSSSSYRAVSGTQPRDAGPPSSLPTVQTRSAPRAIVAASMSPSTPPPRRWPWAVGAAIVAVASIGAGAMLARSAAQRRHAAALSAVSVLDLPAPASSSTLALTAYHEGLQADHDANIVGARADYLEAVGDDRGLGAAHLRYAIDAFTFDVVEARAHFLKAQQLRASLGAHERLLVDGFAPLFDESPPDWAEADRRLEAATHAHPDDAELWYLFGWVQGDEGRLTEATAALGRASALDPSYAAPLEARIATLQLAGDVTGVIAVGDECLKAAPTATGCLRRRLWTLAQEGMCDAYERDARRWLAIDPSNAESYEDLGQVMLARGQPSDGAWEAMRMGWRRATPDYAPWLEADDRSRTAVILGDLPAFDAAMAALTQQNERQTDQYSHFEQAELLVNELTELGSPDRAAEVAAGFLEKRSAWTAEPGQSPAAVSYDDVPLMLHALERGGKISRAELDARRTDWVERWRKRLTPVVTRYLWLFAYAEIAETAADALDALARLPELGPIPRYRPWRFVGARVGRLYLLAGRVDEALPLLEQARAECEPFEEPFTWVQASLWLGQAREQQGDVARACEAYGSVAQRWVGFGARSVTVAEARRRMGALHCGK